MILQDLLKLCKLVVGYAFSFFRNDLLHQAAIRICQQKRIHSCFSVEPLGDQICLTQQIKHASLADFQQQGIDILILVG